MKVCALEIQSNKIIFCVLEKDTDGNLNDITGKVKSIVLDDDHNHEQVIDFVETLHSHFNSLNIDRIIILSRISKGQFSSAGVSFKLEGLIQSYKAKPVSLVSPKTLSAYYKKNEQTIEPQHKYQSSACSLAFHALHN